MTQQSLGKMRLAVLLSATALVAVPAMAQDAQVAPPPVTSTAAPASPTSTVTPPPVVSTVSPSSSASTSDGASSTPVNPDAAAAAAAEDAQRASTRRTAARPAARPAPVRATATRAAPVTAAAPAAATPAATPAPAAAEPAAQPAAQTEAAPAAQAPAEATQQTQQTATESGPPLWPLALIAALIVAAGAAFYFLRRRRERDVYEEPVYAEPVYEQPVAAEPLIERPAPIVRPRHDDVTPAIAAAGAAGVMVDDTTTRTETAAETPIDAVAPEPVMVTDATPVAAEEATVAEAEGEDVAALTATQLNGNRPWLEFAMRPVRAGTNVDEAIVEIELTVANAGNMPADDVRISTFMLPAGSETEMERLLTERHDEAVAPLTIGAGEGTRVDATLVTNKADLVNGAESAAFQPVIVADARYRLPDGSEGRTSASFVVGGTPESGETLEPISLDRPLLREDVEARLYREPARV